MTHFKILLQKIESGEWKPLLQLCKKSICLVQCDKIRQIMEERNLVKLHQNIEMFQELDNLLTTMQLGLQRC